MKIDGRKARKLTPKQLRFVHEFCYHTLTGQQSASESARKAGYSDAIARKLLINYNIQININCMLRLYTI